MNIFENQTFQVATQEQLDKANQRIISHRLYECWEKSENSFASFHIECVKVKCILERYTTDELRNIFRRFQLVL